MKFRIRGFRQKNGRWVAFNDEVSFRRYLQHRYWGLITATDYYKRRLLDRIENGPSK